jgi:endoglucanase
MLSALVAGVTSCGSGTDAGTGIGGGPGATPEMGMSPADAGLSNGMGAGSGTTSGMSPFMAAAPQPEGGSGTAASDDGGSSAVALLDAKANGDVEQTADGPPLADGPSLADTGASDDASSTGATGQRPVASHGRLVAKGNRIVDASGNPVELKGMSLFWSQDAVQSLFYNANVVSWLIQDWHISIIRAAIAVTGKNDGDYLSDPAGNLKRLDAVVQAAINDGIYVIIDWHDSVASTHVTAASQFFATVSQKYAGQPNVIYEIWNEPLGNAGITWMGDIKPYAETISKVIRQHDNANLMVVGTPFWDQQPSVVVGNPVMDPNVAYTLHFYAGSPAHVLAGPIGASAKVALAGGIPLFVTEWGTTDPVNQGAPNVTETRKWWAFLDQNAISSCNWAISTKAEGSAALVQGASTSGQWTAADLTASGTLVRSLLLGL